MSEINGNGSGQFGVQLPIEERERIRLRNMSIADALRAGLSQSEIARQYGVSTATVSNVNRFDLQGIKRWRRPKEKVTAKPAPVMEAIRQAEKELRHAQRNVLLAEALLLDAKAMQCRERAAAIE